MASRAVFSRGDHRSGLGTAHTRPARHQLAFLTQRLNELGVDVRYKVVVGDRPEDVSTAMDSAVPQTDILMVTGGLGPTDDDTTREAVASVFHAPLKEDEGVVASIESLFAVRGLPMPEINRRQALIPEGPSCSRT